MMNKEGAGDVIQEKVNQSVLDQRLKGKLITIDINGHLFYVDIPMGMLRPKDEFMATGIKFDELSPYINDERTTYQIPYNTKQHSYQEVDYETIFEIPKNLLIVEFPHQRFLDPVGYSRKYGLDLKDCLKETGIQSHFTAKIVDWRDTQIAERIADNRKKQAVKIKQAKPIRNRRRI